MQPLTTKQAGKSALKPTELSIELRNTLGERSTVQRATSLSYIGITTLLQTK